MGQPLYRKVLSVKTQRGRPFELFKLPKRFIQPLVKQDGSLNLKIKFVKEHTLTACAQYLQTKIFEFQASPQGQDPSSSGGNSLFLF